MPAADPTQVHSVYTLASSCALLGMNTRGNAYMAPITSLHWKPSIELNVSATNLALSLNDWSTAVFSWKWQDRSTPSYLHNTRYNWNRTHFPNEKNFILSGNWYNTVWFYFLQSVIHMWMFKCTSNLQVLTWKF